MDCSDQTTSLFSSNDDFLKELAIHCHVEIVVKSERVVVAKSHSS